MTDEQMAELKAFIDQAIEAAVMRLTKPTIEVQPKTGSMLPRNPSSVVDQVFRSKTVTSEHPANPLEFWQYTHCQTASIPKSEIPVVVTG